MATPATSHQNNAAALDLALFTDLYEVTMLQSYWEHGMSAPATFELFARTVPRGRNYLVACGLDSVLTYLEHLTFNDNALAVLHRQGFPERFLEWLGTLRFTGDVWAPPEGTPVFGNEPILVIDAPLPEGQIIETYLINQIHIQTLIASKAARVVTAAAGRPVADFGGRRAHGTDAGLLAARASYLAGMVSTSNVAAGDRYGIPVSGTMAHSYVQAHGQDRSAFQNFVATHPDTTLLVDTFDTIAGVRTVIDLVDDLGEAFKVSAIRLDSDPLGPLAKDARCMLDAAGLNDVRIVASGGLDEHGVAALMAEDAPIDAFGVGTRSVTSSDVPTFDAVYKLAAYDGEGRIKHAPGKATLPGRKQVFRQRDPDGVALSDILARADEHHSGEPLLMQVMRNGERLPAGIEPLDKARERAAREIARLPSRVRALDEAIPPYTVTVSDVLRADAARLGRTMAG